MNIYSELLNKWTIRRIIVFLIALATPIYLIFAATNNKASDDEYQILWSDGKSVSIKLINDYIAIGDSAERVRLTVGSLASNVKTIQLGIPSQRFSIAQVTKEGKGKFTSLMRSKSMKVLGIPIRSISDDSEEVVGIVTNEFIVRFEDNIREAKVIETNDKLGAEIVKRSAYVSNKYILKPKDGNPKTALTLTKQYFDLRSTVYAHPNLLIKKVSRTTANDPLLPNQWHLKNTGQKSGKIGADAKVVDAWKEATGEGILIAVIDPEGVQRNHEDLVPNQFINSGEDGLARENGIDDDNNGLIDDRSGWNFSENTGNPTTSKPHGTSAAGVAVAACNNSKGGCGAAPAAKLIGIAQGLSVEDDANAFYYAAQIGADVISNSWGYPLNSLQRPTEAVEEAIAYAASKGRNGKGAVIVFAMTNERVDNFSGPNADISSLVDVIAVGRSTNNDVWGESGFGHGMELLAPTQAAIGTPTTGCIANSLLGTLDITTTDLMNNYGYNSGQKETCFCNDQVSEIHNSPNYTACFGGTSSATPLVAGIAALVLSINPELTRLQVYNILMRSADKIDSDNAYYVPDSNNLLYSKTHGFGRVNALKAVKSAKETL